MTLGYAYLHGFASSPRSKKATALATSLEAHGVELHRPDLNCPSFAALTLSAELEALDALAAAHPHLSRWRLIGSSMGGWLAARWAELHPDRIDRLVLLCPGFDMVERWPKLLGAAAMTRWLSHGSLPFPNAEGVPEPVHWSFIADAQRHPASPVVPCETLIVHGRQDETVPIDTSRAYVAAHPAVMLLEVDDGHELARSLPAIEAAVLDFFGLLPPR